MAEPDFYRRNLPHWQPANAEYFVTFSLNESLPKAAVKQLQEEQQLIKNGQLNPANLTKGEKKKKQKIFQKYEKLLDSSNFGPAWLANPDVAEIVSEALLYRDKKEYDLYAFCIMSNHVHIVFRLLEKIKVQFPVTHIFEKLKSFTALKANRVLKRSGKFWKSESYDHVIRDRDELENIILYVLNNPVKAGLVDTWKEWKYSYCKPEFLDSL